MDLYVKLLDDEGRSSVVDKMRAIHEKAVLEGQLLQGNSSMRGKQIEILPTVISL